MDMAFHQYQNEYEMCLHDDVKISLTDKHSIGGLTCARNNIVIDEYGILQQPWIVFPSSIEMVRRSAGFVTKKPHRKSRGGCLLCKRKKVKVSSWLVYEIEQPNNAI